MSLWAKDPFDFGTLSTALPLVVTSKTYVFPSQPQFPLSQEAINGIMHVFESLLERGAIVPCKGSPVDSLLLPVRKKDNLWQFVIDLRQVNQAVQPVTPVVPSLTTILTAVPSDAANFSVVDVRNAFFSLRVARKSQFWFTLCNPVGINIKKLKADLNK